MSRRSLHFCSQGAALSHERFLFAFMPDCYTPSLCAAMRAVNPFGQQVPIGWTTDRTAQQLYAHCCACARSRRAQTPETGSGVSPHQKCFFFFLMLSKMFGAFFLFLFCGLDLLWVFFFSYLAVLLELALSTFSILVLRIHMTCLHRYQ